MAGSGGKGNRQMEEAYCQLLPAVQNALLYRASGGDHSMYNGCACFAVAVGGRAKHPRTRKPSALACKPPGRFASRVSHEPFSAGPTPSARLGPILCRLSAQPALSPRRPRRRASPAGGALPPSRPGRLRLGRERAHPRAAPRQGKRGVGGGGQGGGGVGTTAAGGRLSSPRGLRLPSPPFALCAFARPPARPPAPFILSSSFSAAALLRRAVAMRG